MNPQSNPGTRFSFSASGYMTIDGRLLGGSSLDAFPLALLSALDVDENGEGYANQTVWTAVTGNGGPMESTCQDWTSNSIDDRGDVGVAGKVNSMWTQTGPIECVYFGRLYCFQQ